MASLALKDATVWVHGYDMTTDLNEIGLDASADPLDNTTFGGGGYRSRIAGFKTVKADLKGFWQAGASSIDAEAFPDLAGTVGRVVTVTPDGAAGSVAYTH